MRVVLPPILLCLTLLLLPLSSKSFLDDFGFRESLTQPVTRSFSLITKSTALQLEVFTHQGEALPATVYRHHLGDKIVYEIGHELPQGLYLIRVRRDDVDEHYKWIK